MASPIDDETVAKLKKMLREGERAPEIAYDCSCSEQTVYKYKREMKDAGELGGDTIPKEKRMTKKDNGGGANVADLEKQLDWYAQREKELLELNAILAGRLVKQMERIEALEAAAPAE